MTEAVHLFSPSVGEINRREVLRYMGGGHSDAEVEHLLDAVIDEAQDAFTYRACARELPILIEGERIDMGFATVQSRDLAKCLADCDAVILFAATVGVGIDRLITRYSRLSPARALCMQALGSERIEALCDALCEEWKREYAGRGLLLRPRFSAGYGDLPLALQTDIFACLNCAKHIGLTLCDSLLMSPTKSVTAIVGVKRKED